ncbi:MAG TPA: nucleotide exchange factor GrpE [Solirubrobacteraceae bacterium]|jgi:molecular chaperone GrpE|nr:nucleotide exchange factor GrpE [Solirubrobacteraceae bacterium]
MPSSPESDTEPTRAPDQEQAQPQNGELAAELERVEDRYKRALADLDNYRKRAAREIETLVTAARESVIRDWLEVVDSVERAMQMEADGPCRDGLRAVLEQMNAVLAREGAQRIGTAGERFDPERHQAIAVQDSADAADRTILAVERSGFALGDRVIRPAQVVVARPPGTAG